MQSMASIWKQQKPCVVDTDIDRISSLPEALISHILSLLPTKFAVRTCVLSKAWELYWTKVASFDFDERETDLSRQGNSFLEFVDMVLTKHSGESINKFRLRSCSFDGLRAAYLRMWVDAALAQNVRVLDLDIGTRSQPSLFHLPDAIFTCGTLEILKLRGRFWVKLALHVRLPNLTVLELKLVEYESEECVWKLLSGCPLLPSFSIRGWTYFRNMMVACMFSSPTSKRYGESVDGKMKKEIEAPALEWNVNLLSCACSSGPNEHIRHSSMLQRALDCGSFPKLYAATKNRWSLGFEGITKLIVRINLSQWSSLVDLLDRCINLEVLHIFRVEEETKGTCWKDLDHVPECLLSLKKVTFRTFYGMRSEMKLLKLILDHGLVMQRVELYSNAHDPDEFDSKSAFLKDLSVLPRVSPTCEITSKVSFS